MENQVAEEHLHDSACGRRMVLGLSFCRLPFIIRVKQENLENLDISGDIQEKYVETDCPYPQ